MHAKRTDQFIYPKDESTTVKEIMRSATISSKRFKSDYCAKVKEGAKKKKNWKGKERGEEEKLARKPHDSGKRPLIFHCSHTLPLFYMQT